MLSKSEESKFSALAYVHLSEVPPEHDGKSVWITALALVKKSNNTLSWCYMERDKQGKPKVMRDFGSMYPIVEYVSVHPILYLERSYLYKTPKTPEGDAKLIEFLKSNGVVMDYENADRKALDKANIAIAIQRQLADAKKKSKLIIKD